MPFSRSCHLIEASGHGILHPDWFFSILLVTGKRSAFWFCVPYGGQSGKEEEKPTSHEHTCHFLFSFCEYFLFLFLQFSGYQVLNKHSSRTTHGLGFSRIECSVLKNRVHAHDILLFSLFFFYPHHKSNTRYHSIPLEATFLRSYPVFLLRFSLLLFPGLCFCSLPSRKRKGGAYKHCPVRCLGIRSTIRSTRGSLA